MPVMPEVAPLVRNVRTRRLRAAVVAGLCAGAVAVPSALAAPPGHGSSGHTPSTRLAGIDVDATTIPQLESLMNHHRLSAVQLVLFYVHRIDKLNPLLHAVITVDRTAFGAARRTDRERRAGDAARCSASRS